jgi:hypothetical protein
MDQAKGPFIVFIAIFSYVVGVMLEANIIDIFYLGSNGRTFPHPNGGL